MAYDLKCQLSGSTPGSGSPIDASVTASANKTAIDMGVAAQREFFAELRIGGAVSGTSPTLDVNIQESADNSTFTDVYAFPQQTATMAGYVTGTTARPEVPGTAALRQKIQTSKRYVRAKYTIGGSNTPTFRNVTVLLVPVTILVN